MNYPDQTNLHACVSKEQKSQNQINDGSMSLVPSLSTFSEEP